MSILGFSPDSNNPIISGSTSIKATKTDLPKITKGNTGSKPAETNKSSEATAQPKTTPKAEAKKNAKHIEEVTNLKEQAKVLERRNLNREISDIDGAVEIQEEETPL